MSFAKWFRQLKSAHQIYSRTPDEQILVAVRLFCGLIFNFDRHMFFAQWFRRLKSARQINFRTPDEQILVAVRHFCRLIFNVDRHMCSGD